MRRRYSEVTLDAPSRPDRFVPLKYRPALRAIVDPSNSKPDMPPSQSPPPPPEIAPFRKTKKARRPLRIRPITKEQHEKSRMPWLFPSSMLELEILREFGKAVRNENSTNEALFELYRQLPGSRLPYMDRVTMERFITRMMTVPLRDQVSMLRYLTVIEDMKASKIPITRNEWNQASTFVTKAFKETTVSEMRAAFELWAESEGDFNVAADTTTFNILLDSASKSKSPIAAQRILKELQSRKLKYDRFTYTTLIMYHAHAGDAAGVRRVYQSLVDAGEAVDNVVLNTLMTALIHCGDTESAEKIFAFMKRAGVMAEKDPSPSMIEYRKQRAYTQKLKRLSSQNVKDYQEYIQLPLGPNVASFHLFVHLHCRNANWDRVQDIIRDMKMFQITLPDSVYLSLLKGFAWWGSSDPYNAWNGARLEEVLRVVLDESAGVITWARVYAVWTIRAVAKVYANREILQKVWEEIVAQWERQGGTINEFAMGVYLAALRDITEEQGDQVRRQPGIEQQAQRQQQQGPPEGTI
jgi:pentatricopeptide repeat protein